MRTFKLLIAAIAMVTMISCGSSELSPSKVAVKQIDCMNTGDIEGILKLIDMTPEQKEQVTPMLTEKMKEGIKATNENSGGYKGSKAISETISEDGTSAEVAVEVTFGDGTVQTVNIDLEKIDGKWLLPNPFKGK